MTGNDLDILSPFVLVMAATMLIEDEPGGFQLLDQDSSIHFAFLPCVYTHFMRIVNRIYLSDFMVF